MRGDERKTGPLFLKWGTAVGLLASLLVAFPTGDAQAKMVARLQPQALAAMEGRFQSGPMAEITLIGQPNVRKRAARQSHPRARHAELPRLRNVSSQRAWTRRVSGRHLAHQYRTAVLLVPRDGGSGHAVHPVDGPREPATAARPSGVEPPAPVGADAGLSVSLHRQHRRMDDRGARAPAVAGVRAVSHARRL